VLDAPAVFSLQVETTGKSFYSRIQVIDGNGYMVKTADLHPSPHFLLLDCPFRLDRGGPGNQNFLSFLIVEGKF
jgi:hypothetical protein